MKKNFLINTIILFLLLPLGSIAEYINYPNIPLGMAKEEFIEYFEQQEVSFKAFLLTSDDGIISIETIDSFDHPAHIMGAFSHEKKLIRLDVYYVVENSFDIEDQDFLFEHLDIFIDLSGKLEEKYGEMLGGQFIVDGVEYNYPLYDSNNTFAKALMSGKIVRLDYLMEICV